MSGWMNFGAYAAPDQGPDPKQEEQALKGQADALQVELDLIKKRLSEIEAGTAKEGMKAVVLNRGGMK
jgi:hypothetical protein